MRVKTRKQEFRQLQALVNQGLNASIIELAHEYLREYPKVGLVWLDYGNALVSLAKYDEARVALSRAIKYVRPEHRHFPCGAMGHLYDSKGDLSKAAEWFEKAAKMTPGEATYLIFLGGALAQAGKFSEAMKSLRRAVKCKEGAIDEAYYNLGAVLAALRRYKEALSCFEKAIALDPKYKLAKKGAKDMRNVLEIKATFNDSMQRTRN